jgi:hypothetical protein
VALTAGCSSANRSGEKSKEVEAIVHVGFAYRDASNVLKRGAASVEEIRPYLKKYGDPDQLLVSPNDGQPYHIVWGVVPGRPTAGAPAQRLLAYEESGKGGKRYALDCMMKVYHLTDAEFTRMRGSN